MTGGSNGKRSDAPAPAPVVQRDDGMFEIWPHGTGPFPTRACAEAVTARELAP
jgi:hypothetical protein